MTSTSALGSGFPRGVRITALALCVVLGCAGGTAPPDWSPPAGLRHRLDLHVRAHGEGARTVLLLHGLGGSNRYYGAVFDRLADTSRVVVPDLLGFGASPWPADAAYDADEHAKAVVRMLDALGVEGPIYVAAHSAGVLVALRLASLQPHRIAGISAFAPPLYRDPSSARVHLRQLGLFTRLFLQDGWLAHLTCRLMCHFRGAAARVAVWLRPDLPPAVASDAVRHRWSSYERTLRALVIEGQPARDLREAAPPLWLVAGDRDPLIDLDYLLDIGQSDRVRVEIWPGGHDLPLRAPEQCVDAIRRLIASVEARPRAVPRRVRPAGGDEPARNGPGSRGWRTPSASPVEQSLDTGSPGASKEHAGRPCPGCDLSLDPVSGAGPSTGS